MKKIFIKEKWNYTLYGVLFGFVFPIVATLLQTFETYKSLSLVKIINIQKTFRLLWIIDTAPIWLGLFAMFGGIQLDKINSLNKSLKEKVKERTAQLEEELEIHKQLVIEKTDACLDAEYSKIKLKNAIEEKES